MKKSLQYFHFHCVPDKIMNCAFWKLASQIMLQNKQTCSWWIIEKIYFMIECVNPANLKKGEVEKFYALSLFKYLSDLWTPLMKTFK